MLHLLAETVVGFEKSSIFAREGGRSAEVCAVIFEPYRANLTEVFTVQIFTEDGLASEYKCIQPVLLSLATASLIIIIYSDSKSVTLIDLVNVLFIFQIL